jgi:heptaprenyl diphosphate synthase
MKTRKIAYLGMLMALALVLSYVESLIPFAVGIPGVKLGLTNIVTVIMLYIAAPMETFLLCVFRAVLSGFMFGNAFSIIYSLAGCILSFIVMYLLKKSDKFSSVSISLVGGVCHNIGQIIVAAIVLSTYSVVYYIVAGCITGLVIGIVASQVLLRISDSFHV